MPKKRPPTRKPRAGSPAKSSSRSTVSGPSKRSARAPAAKKRRCNAPPRRSSPRRSRSMPRSRGVRQGIGRAADGSERRAAGSGRCQHAVGEERVGQDRRATDARHESGRGTARPSARGFGRSGADDQPRCADRRQPELAQSRVARPDAPRGLHPPREDHAFRSRADTRAHRACPRLGSARLLRVLPTARRADTRLDLCRGRQAHAGFRALLDRRR